MDNVKMFIMFLWNLHKIKFNGEMKIKFKDGVPVLVTDYKGNMKIKDLMNY